MRETSFHSILPFLFLFISFSFFTILIMFKNLLPVLIPFYAPVQLAKKEAPNFNAFVSLSLQSFGRRTFNAATPTRPGLRSTSSTQECAPVKKSWRKTTRLSKTNYSL
jgi:hypothetical protein